MSDTIEKPRIIKAPRSRVWRAISDSKQFGAWFRFHFDGPFVANTLVVGVVKEPGYEGARAEFWVDRIEPEHTFSYRWHPFAIDPAVDYSSEPKTLVVFTLADHPEGTLLTIVESGFDAIPVERRGPALHANTGGWAIQIERVADYVTQAS
jgi:uncharacterized protein YndB with AHSA1/START domain